MTDVRVPETDPFESATPERGGRGPASPATERKKYCKKEKYIR